MAERVDDGSIGDHELLWRRILPEWIHRNEDGSYRPQSIAFIDRLSFELSVHLASKTSEAAVLAGHPGDSIVSFEAALPRALGLRVVPDPDPDDPSHVLICPTPEKKSAKVMAKKCAWVRLQK